MRFYNGESWANEWQAELTLPLAIEVKVRFEDYDEISRIYLTPAGTLNASSGGSNNNGNSGGNNQGNNQGSAQGGNS